MRNYESLMQRIAAGSNPRELCSLHIFAHRNLCIPVRSAGRQRLDGTTFFTARIMPGDDLLL